MRLGLGNDLTHIQRGWYFSALRFLADVRRRSHRRQEVRASGWDRFVGDLHRYAEDLPFTGVHIEAVDAR